VITRRGKTIARLVSEHEELASAVDWSQSPAGKRKRSGGRKMTAAESQQLIHEAGGKW
jgi:hypothetical protein